MFLGVTFGSSNIHCKTQTQSNNSGYFIGQIISIVVYYYGFQF